MRHGVGLCTVCIGRHRQRCHAGRGRADCLQFKAEGLGCQRRGLTGQQCPVCLSAEYLRECRIVIKRCHGGPNGVEMHSAAVGRCQVVDRDTVIISRCGRCRTCAPAHELIARAVKLIRREILCRVVSHAEVRHASVHRSPACVRLEYHRIRIRRIHCMYRRIAGHRRTEGISRVVLILPVVEVVAGLIVRYGRRRERSRPVRHIVVLCKLRILMTCIRVRCILYGHRVTVNLPLCVQSCVRMNRCRAKRELGSRRICPVEEVVARLLSRRGGRDADRIVYDRRHCCIVAVAHTLVCRGVAAALCVVLHREARQGVAVLKLQLGRRSARAAACFLHRSGNRQAVAGSRTERTRALRHRKGNRVDSRIVAVVLCGARGLLEGVDIGTRVAEGKETRREGYNCGRARGRRCAARCRNLQLCARKRIAHGSRPRRHRDARSGAAARHCREHCRCARRCRDRL